MKRITYTLRFIYIQYILAKYGIDRIFFSMRWFSPFWFITFLNPWNWFRKANEDRGVAIRSALEELGPIFVKFGQMLSTRQDLLPEDIIKELKRLQDDVPPFPPSEARTIIEKNLGHSIETLFLTFENQPLAAASIAQVHSAVLSNGQSVVVKILRPGIHKQIQRDIDLLYALARLAEHSKRIRRLKPKAIIEEFEVSLLDELDLRREAGNASQLRRNFLHSPLLYVPEIKWKYTTHDVMVMERIEGIPIADREALLAHHIDLPTLAAYGVELFFTQVFRDSFFHADMHPGNIFVSKQHPENPQYICVDFGIMGTLTDSDKRYIAENLFAFFNRDYGRIARLHVESGWLNADVRLDRFESAIRAVSEPIFEKPLREISFAEVVYNLIQTARQFHINIQPQLILLQKTLFAVEGLGRYLDPNLDLWITAKPFLERWTKEQLGLKAFRSNLKENLPFLTEHLPEFPRLLYQFLKQERRPVSVPREKLTSRFRQRMKVGVSFLLGAISSAWIMYYYTQIT